MTQSKIIDLNDEGLNSGQDVAQLKPVYNHQVMAQLSEAEKQAIQEKIENSERVQADKAHYDAWKQRNKPA